MAVPREAARILEAFGGKEHHGLRSERGPQKVCSVPTLKTDRYGKGQLRPIHAMKNNSQQYLPLGDLVRPRVDFNQAMIDEVISRFDFQRVQTVMDAVGWTYFGESEAPSIQTLRANARELLEAVIEEKEEGFESQSGGFRASWYPDDSILLTFVVASGHACKGDVIPLPEPSAGR